MVSSFQLSVLSFFVSNSCTFYEVQLVSSEHPRTSAQECVKTQPKYIVALVVNRE